MLSLPQRAQPADQQQELPLRGLALLGREAFRGLQHRHASGVARVVRSERLPVGPQRVRLGDDVQRPALIQQQVDVGERLQPGPEPRLGAAHALTDGADPPGPPGEHGDDPVRLTQVLSAQHDPVIPVQSHPVILPHPGDIAGRRARPVRADRPDRS